MEPLDRYRWAVGELLSPGSPESWHRRPGVVQAVRELSEALRFSRSKTVGRPYLQDEETLQGYLAYFTPWNLLRLRMLFRQHGGAPLVLRHGEDPVTVIDLGSGPLVFALYLALAHPELHQRRIVFHAVDTATEASELGAALLRKLAPEHQWEVKPLAAEFDDVFDRQDLLPWADASLVVETFSLNEWARSRYRREKLLTLRGALGSWLRPGTEILFVEPGNREAGRLLPALRAEILEAESARIIGPCTHASSCPLIRTRDRSWCHFRRDVVAPDWLVEVGNQAELPKEKLFFSYLWWIHGEESAARPAGADRPGTKGTRLRARILGAPMQVGFEHQGIYACDSTGRVLLTWKANRTPPPDMIANGAIIERVDREALRLDGRSSAAVYPFPTEPTAPEPGRQGRREPPRRGPASRTPRKPPGQPPREEPPSDSPWKRRKG